MKQIQSCHNHNNKYHIAVTHLQGPLSSGPHAAGGHPLQNDHLVLAAVNEGPLHLADFLLTDVEPQLPALGGQSLMRGGGRYNDTEVTVEQCLLTQTDK